MMAFPLVTVLAGAAVFAVAAVLVLLITRRH